MTGAASGIGKACVQALLNRGAAVVAVDINRPWRLVWQRADCAREDYLGITADLTSTEDIRRVIERRCAAMAASTCWC